MPKTPFLCAAAHPTSIYWESPPPPMDDEINSSDEDDEEYIINVLNFWQ